MRKQLSLACKRLDSFIMINCTHWLYMIVIHWILNSILYTCINSFQNLIGKFVAVFYTPSSFYIGQVKASNGRGFYEVSFLKRIGMLRNMNTSKLVSVKHKNEADMCQECIRELYLHLHKVMQNVSFGS